MAKSCPTLYNLMDWSMPGFFPDLHNLPVSQIHVHWVGGAIQTSHPLLPLSPSAFNLLQHQGLFHWVNSSHQVTKVLELQLQHQLHANKNVFKPGNLCIKWIWKQHKGLKGNKGSQWQRSQSRVCCSPSANVIGPQTAQRSTAFKTPFKKDGLPG